MAYDPTKPAGPNATTQSVRDNFVALKEQIDTPEPYGDIIWSGSSTNTYWVNVPLEYRVRSGNIGSWVGGQSNTDSALLFVVVEPTVSQGHFEEWSTYVFPIMIRWPIPSSAQEQNASVVPIQRRTPGTLYSLETGTGAGTLVLRVYFAGHHLISFSVEQSGGQVNEWWRITEIRSLSRKAGSFPPTPQD